MSHILMLTKSYCTKMSIIFVNLQHYVTSIKSIISEYLPVAEALLNDRSVERGRELSLFVIWGKASGEHAVSTRTEINNSFIFPQLNETLLRDKKLDCFIYKIRYRSLVNERKFTVSTTLYTLTLIVICKNGGNFYFSSKHYRHEKWIRSLRKGCFLGEHLSSTSGLSTLYISFTDSHISL